MTDRPGPGKPGYARSSGYSHGVLPTGPGRLSHLSLASVIFLVLLPCSLSAQAESRDLTNLLAPGHFLQDRNEDGHPDFVHAGLVIPARVAEAEAVAAANMAARLAFESYGADLEGLWVDGEGVSEALRRRPLVVVGNAREALGAAGIDADAARARLGPGEGVVMVLSPTEELPAGGVWLEGGDASGLLEASRYASARYPAIWDPGGDELGEVVERLARFLQEAGVAHEAISLDRAMVAHGREGIRRLGATVQLAQAGVVEEVEGLFREPEAGALVPPGVLRMEMRLEGPDRRRDVTLLPSEPWEPEGVGEWDWPDPDPFTLSKLYTIDGLYQDTREDLIPDRTRAYLSLHGTEGVAGAANLARRIALETAGAHLPLVRPAARSREDEGPGLPILYGLEHPVTEELLGKELLTLPTGRSGEGFIELVRDPEGDATFLVVAGSDEAGLTSAVDALAGRFPYLWENRKGEWGLAELEREVRRFFQARSVAGQTGLALYKLDRWLERLEGGERPGVPPSDRAQEGGGGVEGPPPEVHVELALDTVADGLSGFVEERVRSVFPDARVEVSLHPTGFGAGEEVFALEEELGWEVDRVRAVLEEQVYPLLSSGDSLRLEIGVSEPPEVRRRLEDEIRQALTGLGFSGDGARVQVVNAYKQGYSWIVDHVLPRLQGEEVAEIEIEYHHLGESDEISWKIVGSDTRWLQELFPVDGVLARELGIPDSAVVFRATGSPEPVYRLRALDGAGELVLDEEFTPRYRIRPYFDLHPEYERVRVSTGWVTAEIQGETVVDQKVRTDMEAFWDRWQGGVLPEVRDYLMDLQEGDPSPEHAPFFDELRVDVRLSEPNHRIGIDEEVISSLESLHNELYFHTLAFLDHLGRHYERGPLRFAGRVLPYIDPDGDGEPGWFRVSLTGRERAGPRMVLRTPGQTAGGGGEPARWSYDLSSLPTETPELRGAALSSEGEGVDRFLFHVMARDSVDRFPEYRERASEEVVDREFLSVETLEGMVEAVRKLHGAGVLGSALAFEGVEGLLFRFQVEGEEDFRRMTALEAGPEPGSTRNPRLEAPGFEPDGERMVQWRTPIPPAENDTILAHLQAFPEAEVYLAGRSFLGREIHAADFLPPTESELRSQAKLNALRPTVFFSGRQHANEVSSTSHILRLGELLVTDPKYRDLLRRVNVVLHPITNPDGAQLAFEMQKVNPDFTLHAGYLGALGVDVTTEAAEEDPIYPESRVRPELMATWLPDVYINMHGYPSHEWVQHFSAYAAWVRGRTVTSRSWWAPRGWFIPGFSWVDDPEYPEIREAQFAILDTIAAAITGEPEVQEMSQRQYARYAKYGRQDVEGFREHFHDGMLIYKALRGREVEGSGPDNPRINTFSAVTEAPDETARGDWLELVSSAGLAHSSALIRYLATGANRVKREAEAYEEGVLRRMFRERPVLPPGDERDRSDPGGR